MRGTWFVQQVLRLSIVLSTLRLDGVHGVVDAAIATASEAKFTLQSSYLSSSASSLRRSLRIVQRNEKEENNGGTEDEDEDDESSNNGNGSSSNTNNNGNGNNNNNQADDQAASSTRGQVDLVHLVPFDVQIAVTKDEGIQAHEVANIVTTWMNAAYVEQLRNFGFTEANLFASFDSVVLFNNDESENSGNGSTESDVENRRLRQRPTRSNSIRRGLQSGELFTAKFRGGAVFSRDETRTKSVPPNDVLLIQQMTLLNDTVLVDLLQSSSVLGLGSAVVDVNAFLTPQSNSGSSSGTSNANSPKSNRDNESSESSDLEYVIIAAIAVACVAFLFLLGAVIWAYRYDRSNRDAFLVKEHKLEQLQIASALEPSSPDRTDSDTMNGDNDSPERIRAVHVERSSNQNGLNGNHLACGDGMHQHLNQQHGMLMNYPTVIGVSEDADAGYPESVISDSIISGSVLSEDISTSLSQYYRSGMGKVSSADYALNGGLLSDAGSVSSMESYGYSLDGGMSANAAAAAPLPSEIMPYAQDRGERIGGLPVVPAGTTDMENRSLDNYDLDHDDDDGDMDDVQIPDLDKELANLDIQLIPNMEPIDVESYSQQDLEQYQRQDLEEMEALSQTSPHYEALTAAAAALNSPASSTTGSRPTHIPIDVDEVGMNDEDDDDNDDAADKRQKSRDP